MIKQLLLLFLIVTSLTACKKPSQTVVVAGDSWAFFVCAEKGLQDALTKNGFTDTKVNDTCLVTTRVGSRADRWLGTDHHKATVAALLDESVKVLYLSLGGNDSLSKWNRTFSDEELDAVGNEVQSDLRKVVNVYQTLRPDIKILIAGYDFPRFTPNHPIKNYNEMYEDMGRPSPLEINTMLIKFSEKMAQISDQKSIFYMHNIGLMHYYYGISEVGVSPFSTTAPEFISAPNAPLSFGGLPDYMSDPSSMRNIEGIIVDAFHLTSFGYSKIAEHAVSLYIGKWLQKPNTQN